MPVSEWIDGVERPRLEEMRRTSEAHRLTVVCGGPGFGKTTLLRDWADRDLSALYPLAPADRAVPVLGQGLMDALRLRVPRLARDLPSVSGPILGEAAVFASELARALHATLTRPLTLLLDDVDELAESGGALLVEALVRQAPPELRIVVAGRAEPPFRIARLVAAGEVVRITSSDLAFTFEESRAVVRAVLPDASPEVADEIHRMTGGWPVAVRLAAEALRGSGPGERRRVLGGVAARGGPLFAYLAEEVIGRESESDRDLLRKLAVVDDPDPELWEVLGFPDARERLARLTGRGISVVGTESPRLAPLVAEHLRAAAPLSTGERRELLVAASRWHASRLEWRAALVSALASGDRAAIGDGLSAYGGAVLAGGGAGIVRDAVAVLGEGAPAEIRRLAGEALQVLGDWDGALDVLGELAAGEGPVDPGVAWRLGLIHHMRGDIAAAVEVYERGDRGGPPADAAMLLGWWASAVWLTADAEACRTLTEEALGLARQSGDDRALATAYTVRAMLAALDGDRGANEAFYLRALGHAERAGDVLQQMRIHSNRGSRFLEEGSYVEAIDETGEALRLAELSDTAMFRALALLNLGQARLRTGMVEEAAADFTRARDLWTELRSRQVAYALVGLGDVHRIRGDRVQSRSAYEEALALSEPVGDVQGVVPALVGLSHVLRGEDAGEAVRLAERAVDVGVTLDTVAALVALGWARLSAGDDAGARAAADEAARLASHRRDRAGIAEALELAAEVDPGRAGSRLDEAAALWIGIGDPLGAARVWLARVRLGVPGVPADVLDDVAAVLGRLGARDLLAEAVALAGERRARAGDDVRIETLGGFRVVVAGEPVPVAAWQSKKARDALKILVARRGRPIHREELQELLWPGEDPARSANRLSVALTVVRSVLDPGRRREVDRYVFADRTCVNLVLDRVGVDVEEFLAASRRGLDGARRGDPAAVAHLRRAEGMYRGSFLEEDPYEDWSAALREEARVAYLAVARALAADASRAGDADGASRFHLRILQLDPYDEVAHLGLVGEMERGGRHGEARRLYREYCARMAELDVEAAPFP